MEGVELPFFGGRGPHPIWLQARRNDISMAESFCPVLTENATPTVGITRDSASSGFGMVRYGMVC